MQGLDLLEKLIVVLAAAVIVVPLFQWLRLSAILGYLAIGVVIGPHGVGLVQESESTRLLGEFGVVFLMFTIGLELSVERMRAMRRYIIGLGASQVLVTGAVLGGATHWLFGMTPGRSMLIGFGLALSSTAIVIQLLHEQRIMIARSGRATVSTLLLQDLAVVPLLAFVPLLADGGGPVLTTMGLAALKAALAVGAIVFIGRLLLRPLFRALAVSRNHELFPALVLLVALGTGWATHSAGLSMALGAFLAGLLLAGSEYRHQVEANIMPFRGIFLGLFFITVGMTLDPALFVQQPWLLAGLVVGLSVVKAVIVAGLAKALALPWATCVRAGLLLAGAGEFAFVVFGFALTLGVLPMDQVQILITLAGASMALTPVMAVIGRIWSDRLRRVETSELETLRSETGDRDDHVIIAGFGRVGQTVARMLAEVGIRHVALDLDAGRVEQARARGSMVYFGNAELPDVLEAAGASEARAVIVTLTDPWAVRRIVSVLHARYPRLKIIARAHDLDHSILLERCGATVVVPEILEASLELGAAALRVVNASEADVALMVERIRARHYRELAEVVPKTVAGPADDVRRPAKNEAARRRAPGD